MAAENFDMDLYKKALKKADKEKHKTEKKPVTFRTVGIPLKEVGQRLQELNDAISKHDMAISADAQYNLEFMERHDDMAKCVTMTVYFFSKDE